MAELREQLFKLNNSNEYPFHMPGHKRLADEPGFESVSSIDITEIEGYDDLYHASGIIKQALDRVAALRGADRTWFLVNGSTVGILTSVFSLVKKDGHVLVARNCHKSVYHAVELRDLKATYIYPEMIGDICKGIKAEAVEAALDKHNDIEAVVITSPTYEGIISNIEAIAEVCHKNGIPLIVDEAHGAHFGYHPDFPDSSVKYADVVIQSTHKTLPTLTQTGLLHINRGLVDETKIEKYISMFQTSSPSYVLMSSIDACMEKIENYGAKLWDTMFEQLKRFNNSCVKKLMHLEVLSVDDPCKIVVSTRNSNITGKMLANILLEKYELQVEMSMEGYTVLIVTCNDTEAGFERLGAALLEIDSGLTGKSEDVDNQTFVENISAMTISEATNRDKKLCPLELADGMISAGYIMAYPPGIPMVVPGEKITATLIEEIKRSVSVGLSNQGIFDENIYVVEN